MISGYHIRQHNSRGITIYNKKKTQPLQCPSSSPKTLPSISKQTRKKLLREMRMFVISLLALVLPYKVKLDLL